MTQTRRSFLRTLLTTAAVAALAPTIKALEPLATTLQPEYVGYVIGYYQMLVVNPRMCKMIYGITE